MRFVQWWRSQPLRFREFFWYGVCAVVFFWFVGSCVEPWPSWEDRGY